MKKVYILSILVLAMLASACTREMVSLRGGKINSADIKLSVFSLDPRTRATETGDSLYTYNENAIHDFWYYITSDAAGEELLTSGYVASADTTFTIDDIIGSLTNNTCYVYVFANIPKSSKSTHKDFSGGDIMREDLLLNANGDPYEMTGAESFEDLKALRVTSSFYDDYKDNRGRTGVNGNIHTDNHFVMLSTEPQEVILKEGINRVDVGLARVAAKVSLALDVVKTIDQFTYNPDNSENYVKTWIADYDNIQIYLMWVSKHGEVNGTPIRYSQSTSNPTSQYFISYPRYSMFNTGMKGGTLIPTVSTAEKQFVSYVIGSVPEATQQQHEENSYEAELDDAGQPTGRTKITSTREVAFMNSLPFFTYPIEWEQSDANAPYFKIILPWQGYNKNTKQYDTDADGNRKPQEFYYKITLPNLNELSSNTSYRITLDIGVLGNPSDDVPVELSGEYYVVGWDDPLSTGGALDAGSYLSARDTLYMYGADELDIETMTSHHLESVSISSKWYDYYALAEKTGLPEKSPAATATIDGSTVKFKHTLRSKLSDISSTGVDVSAITFDLSITNAAGVVKKVVVVQYPPIYVDTKPGGSVFVNGYFAHVLDPEKKGVGSWASRYTTGGEFYASSDLQGFGNRYVLSNGYDANSQYPFTRGYGPVSEQNPYNQKDLVRLNISAIPSDLTFTDHTEQQVHYIIGDPREGSGWNDQMFDYKTGATTTGDWSDKADIKKGTTQTNIIAPSLIFSSGWSTMASHNTSPSWQIAANRCATYQEGGYPAGRWRLATEAEINFVRLLQDNNYIQDIFADNNYYSSSGYTYNGSVYRGPYINSQETGGYIRCVYDIWYWGEKPETAYEYHAEP